MFESKSNYSVRITSFWTQERKFKGCIRSVAFSESETWTQRKIEESVVKSFEIRYWRKCLKKINRKNKEL